MTRHWHGIYAILAVVLSFCLGLNVMRTQSVYFSNDTGTLRDAEAITIFLKDRLGTGDAVLAVCPSDWPLMYYFNKHDVPVKYLSLDPEAIRRVFLVVNDYCQTLEGLLEKAGFPQPYEGLPKLIQRFDSATLYEVNTKNDWR